MSTLCEEHPKTKNTHSQKPKPRQKKRYKRTPRKDLYDEVTQKIIKEIEAGRLPWVQPWARPDVKAPLGLPVNAKTSNEYSGVNIVLLWVAGMETARTTPFWLTYKQAQDLGGQIRKGEKATTVCYADSFIPKDERERAKAEDIEPNKVRFLKRYNVFNADQCEGLAEAFYETVPPLGEREIIPIAERLIKNTGINFNIGGDRAFYDLESDSVQVPHQQYYDDQINYYRTCFHELGHATGAEHRLDRDFFKDPTLENRAKEELVAEICAAMICASLHIEPTVRHSDYVGDWLQLLKNDTKAIFKAASQASKAANYVLSFLDHPSRTHETQH